MGHDGPTAPYPKSTRPCPPAPQGSCWLQDMRSGCWVLGGPTLRVRQEWHLLVELWAQCSLGIYLLICNAHDASVSESSWPRSRGEKT